MATSSSLEFTHERCQETCRYSRAHILAREFWICEKQRPVVWKEVNTTALDRSTPDFPSEAAGTGLTSLKSASEGR